MILPSGFACFLSSVALFHAVEAVTCGMGVCKAKDAGCLAGRGVDEMDCRQDAVCLTAVFNPVGNTDVRNISEVMRYCVQSVDVPSSCSPSNEEMLFCYTSCSEDYCNITPVDMSSFPLSPWGTIVQG